MINTGNIHSKDSMGDQIITAFEKRMHDINKQIEKYIIPEPIPYNTQKPIYRPTFLHSKKRMSNNCQQEFYISPPRFEP